MTIIDLTPTENGAYRNQTKKGSFARIPEGWAVVPPEWEAAAAEYLPWLRLTVTDGAITGIGEDAEKRAAFEAAEAQNEEENTHE